MNNNPVKLCAKCILFILTVLLCLFPISAKIIDYQKKYEPRSSLLNRVDMKGYSYVLMGDSAFCSCYVDSDDDSIWKKFESFTGLGMYPAVLNGASKDDLLNAAKYISRKLPGGATVFIDIVPSRLMTSKRTEINNYERELADLFQEEDFAVYKYFNRFNLSYLEYLQKFSSGKKRDVYAKENYQRLWNVDGDFARERYAKFREIITPASLPGNMFILKQMHDLFAARKINAVYVLTPLNKKLIYTYSDASAANELYGNLKATHEVTRKYLGDNLIPYLDLFEAAPPECFADLLHTNARGDEIIARSLASYLSQSGR